MDMRGLHSGKFAEDFYLMVMSSPLRNRLEVLGKKYGLDRAALMLEIMRYAETFTRWADDRRPGLPRSAGPNA